MCGGQPTWKRQTGRLGQSPCNSSCGWPAYDRIVSFGANEVISLDQDSMGADRLSFFAMNPLGVHH